MSGDTVAGVLFGGRCRYGVPVVAAEEDDRNAKCGGEVESGVGIAFAGGAIAEVTNDDETVLLTLEEKVQTVKENPDPKVSSLTLKA